MRFLFLSYYWLPSGKASIHLPLDLIRHFVKAGHQCTVLTVEEDGFTQKEKDAVVTVPGSVDVHRTFTLEPFMLYKLFIGKKPGEQLVASETISKENTSLSHRISLWIRLNLFVPDARIGWYPFAVGKGRKLLQESNFDAIISVGPPHSVHLAARKLSKKSGVPYIPIFIDPWVDIAYYKGLQRSNCTRSFDTKLEAATVRDALFSVLVTETLLRDFQIKYPPHADRMHTLYWGYDEDRFPESFEKTSSDEKVILHAGNIFDFQNPAALWKEIKRRIDQGEQYKIRFIGTVAPAVKASVKELGLEAITEYKGFLPYRDAVKEMQLADFLLVCATEPRHTPGKLFEYLRTHNRIIAFGEDNREVAQILEKSGCGRLYQYGENASDTLDAGPVTAPDTDFISSFDRSKIATQLIALIELAKKGLKK